MREYANDHRPYCRRVGKGCSARSKSGRCNALSNTKFGSKPCPFYKTWEQQKVEHQATYERLIVLERYDLLETYRPEEYLRNKKRKMKTVRFDDFPRLLIERRNRQSYESPKN